MSVSTLGLDKRLAHNIGLRLELELLLLLELLELEDELLDDELELDALEELEDASTSACAVAVPYPPLNGPLLIYILK